MNKGEYLEAMCLYDALPLLYIYDKITLKIEDIIETVNERFERRI